MLAGSEVGADADAAHPKVRDAASLATLYELIGIPGPVQNRYDTVAARIMGKRVRAELS